MSMRLHRWGRITGLAVLSLAAVPAMAGLGGDLSSVQADRADMKAQIRATPATVGYSVEQMQLPGGTVVSEYVSPDGKVFAVSWHGPSKPDLRDALGSYFQQYVTARGQVIHSPGMRRHFQITEPDLVVESSGRMRAFYGRAYVPSLLPPNVSVADIQ
jgi:hypothetical protein